MRRVPMRRVPKHRGTGREEQSAEVPEEPSAEPCAVAEVPSISPSAEPVGMNAEARAAAEREAAVAEMAALEAGFESD